MRDASVCLKDILESSGRIITKVSKLSLEEFRNDIDAQDAVIRRFEIIGEAVKRVPDEIKNQYPDIPWKDASGFRDVLIHDYPEVVIDSVYVTAKEHLPQFQRLVEAVLNNLKS